MALRIPSLPYTLHGATDDMAPAILFVHGWPDDENVFAAQVAHFAPRYKIACVRLPYYGARAVATADAAARKYDAWGYDFDMLVEGVVNVARDALGATEGGRKLRIVGHDWGAFIAFLTEQSYPDLFSHVVGLDVGLPKWVILGSGDSTNSEVLAMLYVGFQYQFALILAFLLSLVPGLGGAADALATFMARKIADTDLYSRRKLPALRAASPVAAGIHARSGYTYYYLWRAFVRGLCGQRVDTARRVLVADRARLRADRHAYPVCPVLFIHGGLGLLFHDNQWLRHVERRGDGSRGVVCRESRHWLLVEEADKVNKEMDDFFEGHRESTSGMA